MGDEMRDEKTLMTSVGLEKKGIVLNKHKPTNLFLSIEIVCVDRVAAFWVVDSIHIALVFWAIA